MNKAQQEDLFIEWDLYEAHDQKVILDEYRRLHSGDYSKRSFLEFLKVKLEIEGYWKKVGLA